MPDEACAAWESVRERQMKVVDAYCGSVKKQTIKKKTLNDML